MIVKVHEANDNIIISVIDTEMLGKKFIEKKLQLDLTSDFYNGEEKNEEEITKLVQCAYLLHLVGQSSVNLGIKMGWIDKSKVLKISNVPHAEVLFG